MPASTSDTLQNEVIGSFLSEKLPAQDDFRMVYIDSDGLPYEYTLAVWGPTSWQVPCVRLGECNQVRFVCHIFAITSKYDMYHLHKTSTIWMFPKIVGFLPKSSTLIGFSIINHPFWGTTIFGNPHIHYTKSYMMYLHTNHDDE